MRNRFLLALTLMVGPVLSAQSPTALCAKSFKPFGHDSVYAADARQIAGMVVDSAGYRIDAATVTITDAPTVTFVQHKAFSGPTGSFHFDGLVPGRYSVTASRAGYSARSATFDVAEQRGAVACLMLDKDAASDVWKGFGYDRSRALHGKAAPSTADSLGVARAAGLYFAQMARAAGGPFEVRSSPIPLLQLIKTIADSAIGSVAAPSAAPREKSSIGAQPMRFWHPDSAILSSTGTMRNCGRPGLNSFTESAQYVFARSKTGAWTMVAKEGGKLSAFGVCDSDIAKAPLTQRLELVSAEIAYGLVADLQRSMVDSIFVLAQPRFGRPMEGSAIDSTDIRDRANACASRRGDSGALQPVWCTFIGRQVTIRIERIIAPTSGAIDGAHAQAELTGWGALAPRESGTVARLTTELIRAGGEWHVVQVTRKKP